MADEIAKRAHRILPVNWFPASLGDAGVLRAVLAMPQAVGAWWAELVAYVSAQARLSTSTGGWLDLAALDFFGTRIRRRAGQSDEGLRGRILAELLRPRVTREAMRRLLLDLTGREPRLFEPDRPADTGGYGVPMIGYGVPSSGYGSFMRPGEVFVDVYRNLTAGVPLVAGYNSPQGKYGTGGYSAYTSSEMVGDVVTDQDILDAMLANAAEGIVLWTKIQA